MKYLIKSKIRKSYWFVFYKILYSGSWGFHLAKYLSSIKNIYSYRLLLNDKQAIKNRFKKAQGYELNLESPITMNEKLQWLKLNDRTELHTLFADKWLVRNYIKNHYDEDILTEVVFQTFNWRDILIENMPDCPFIIKPNHASGWYHFVYDKTKVNWNQIRLDCRFWLTQNYYYFEREWQYKNINPCLIVEKLLIPQNGGIPNNYRLHCLSGNVEIISINFCFDHPNEFIAKKFDKNWNQLDFKFGVENKVYEKYLNIKIDRPKTLDRMIHIAEDIAKKFAYVRVDFYEVDHKLYFNEITFHDSGGYDKIIPFEWDIKLGNLMPLNREKKPMPDF